MNTEVQDKRLKIQRSGRHFWLPKWITLASFICVVPILLSICYWIIHQSEKTSNAIVASKLQTILKLESEAVRQWVKSEEQLASVIAKDVDLAEMMSDMQRQGQQGSEALNRKLLEISQKLENETCLLMTVDGTLVAHSGKNWLTEQIDHLDSRFCEALMSGESNFSPVFPQRDPLSNEEQFLFVVSAPVQHQSKGIVGFLQIGYDARQRLTSVVSSSRAGETGETIAVTQSGVPISQSRFGDSSGLLSFFSDVHGNEIRSRSSKIKTDLTGTTDQRGADTVFASRWMPEIGIGLITKMDRSEASAPVIRLRQFMWTLCGLLLLTTILTVFYRWYIYRLRAAAKRNELARAQLGPYELAGKIGEGGMGIVYRARHELLRRPTAVKVLPPEKSSQTAVRRFEREVQFTSQLKHPNTIAIYDYGRTENGLFYYAMELLEGLNLDELIRREGPLPDGRVVAILRQVCESLREAHSLGLVHRDIKPANIMLCDRGGAFDTVKVLDFGMVRDRSNGPIEFNGKLSGTPAYMAPECFTDPTHVDTRIDVFALGAVGFFLLTGESLFQVNNLNQLIRLHQSDIQSFARQRMKQFQLSSSNPMSDETIELICRCVATEKQTRPDSIEFVLSELAHCRTKNRWDSEQAKDWWQSLAAAGVACVSRSANADRDEVGLSMDTTQAFELPTTAETVVKRHRLVECQIA